MNWLFFQLAAISIILTATVFVLCDIKSELIDINNN